MKPRATNKIKSTRFPKNLKGNATASRLIRSKTLAHDMHSSSAISLHDILYASADNRDSAPAASQKLCKFLHMGT